MKVFFAEDISRVDSGKHKFLNRLSKCLIDSGIEISKNKPDIFLHLGRNMDSCSNYKKSIIRLDGLILNNKQNYKKANKKLSNAIGHSDAVVYQSDFSKQAYEKFLGINKENICIPNGADTSEFPSRNVQDFFLASCRWRPHKRLKDICESFIYAKNKGLKSRLIIAGDPDFKIKHTDIDYIGWIKPKKLNILLSKAVGCIHLSWLDWCPNSMIESIVAGCPVIYSDSGGSSEIGQKAGIGIRDKQWDFTPCDL